MGGASRRALVWLGCLLLVGGCAPKRPVLYPNPALERAGRARSEQDIQACLGLAASQGYGPRQVERTAASSAGPRPSALQPARRRGRCAAIPGGVPADPPGYGETSSRKRPMRAK
jgi:hypothetical protein